MPITLNFEKDELNDLIAFYEQKKSLLMEQIYVIETKLNTINTHSDNKSTSEVLDLHPANPKKTDYPVGYPKKGNWLVKILFTMELFGGSSTTKEIVDKIMEIQNEPKSRRSTLVRSISSVLSLSIKKKKLSRTTNSDGEYIYQLINDQKKEDNNQLMMLPSPNYTAQDTESKTGVPPRE